MYRMGVRMATRYDTFFCRYSCGGRKRLAVAVGSGSGSCGCWFVVVVVQSCTCTYVSFLLLFLSFFISFCRRRG